MLELLAEPIPILGLHAPSGAGKSSLLAAGVVPRLRDAGHRVAVIRHPAEPGLAARLIEQLVTQEGGEPPSADTEAGWRSFVDAVAATRRISGKPPVLVLDQFEDVLRTADDRPRAAVGVLLASSIRPVPGVTDPLCRWLLAYRQEFHGPVESCLRDGMSEAKALGWPALDALVAEFDTQDRFHRYPLLPFGTPPSGAASLTVRATDAFRDAIEKPLWVLDDRGELHYPWRKRFKRIASCSEILWSSDERSWWRACREERRRRLGRNRRLLVLAAGLLVLSGWATFQWARRDVLLSTIESGETGLRRGRGRIETLDDRSPHDPGSFRRSNRRSDDIRTWPGRRWALGWRSVLEVRRCADSSTGESSQRPHVDRRCDMVARLHGDGSAFRQRADIGLPQDAFLTSTSKARRSRRTVRLDRGRSGRGSHRLRARLPARTARTRRSNQLPVRDHSRRNHKPSIQPTLANRGDLERRRRYWAYAYAAWLGGRLPTSAEWEYAARAGCAHLYCDRSGERTTLGEIGWYRQNSDRTLQPGMRLEPNPWGLYDVFGNAWEWTADWIADYPTEPQTDPWGPAEGTSRVIRGGSVRAPDWRFGSAPALRDGSPPENEPCDGLPPVVGFRVVLPSPGGR